MEDRFLRTRMLLGEKAMERLENARVAVFGVGGVGGYAVEALVRSGVGEIDVVDNDIVSISNLNRQIIALEETVGEFKVDVIARRAKSINPNVKINAYRCFFLPENAGEFDFKRYTYVIDAVDTVTAKIEIIMRAKEAGIGVISCMGAGNKRDASRFEVADIFDTSVCPLARTMRYELKKRGIRNLKVVYSKEKPIEPKGNAETAPGRRSAPASCAFVPAVAGLIAAGEVVNDIAMPI